MFYVVLTLFELVRIRSKKRKTVPLPPFSNAADTAKVTMLELILMSMEAINLANISIPVDTHMITEIMKMIGVLKPLLFNPHSLYIFHLKSTLHNSSTINDTNNQTKIAAARCS